MPNPRRYKESDRSIEVEKQIAEVVKRIQEKLDQRERQNLDTVLFIPITGGEGAGKSTLLTSLKELLTKNNISTEVVKMLGGTDFANSIRSLVLSDGASSAAPLAARHIFQTAMGEAAYQAFNLGRQSESQPIIIFADRSPFDTAAYQGHATQRRPREQVLEMANENIRLFAEARIIPTETWYIDLDPEIGLRRKYDQQPEEVNRFEEMGLDFHQRVRDGFQMLENYYFKSSTINSLDGNQSPNELVLEALTNIDNLLTRHDGRVVVGGRANLYTATDLLMRTFNDFGKNTLDELDLKRVLRIIDSNVFSRVGGVESYIEVLRKIFFRLRSARELTPEMRIKLADIIRQTLLSGKNFKMVVDDFMYDPNAFINSFQNMSLEELISDGWRKMNALMDGYKYVIRYVETFDYTQVDYPYQEEETR